MARNDNDRSSMFEGAHMDLSRERDEQRHKFNQALTGVDVSGTVLEGVDPQFLNRAAFDRALRAVANEKTIDRLPDTAFLNTHGDQVIFQSRDGRDVADPSVPRFSVALGMLADDAQRLGIQSPHEASQFQARQEQMQNQVLMQSQQKEVEQQARLMQQREDNMSIGPRA